MNADHPSGRAFFFEGGKHGCLLLHGFTGTPGHMRFLGEQLHKEGYTVCTPMLPGHGATLEAMRASNWQAWLTEARTSYSTLRKTCDLVTVIGLSMGGALALILAEEYPVDSVVCLSAAIRIRARLAWAAPILSIFQPYQRWADGERKVSSDFLHAYDCGYEGMPLQKVHDLTRIMRLAERNLFAVVAPALIIQPEQDQTVDPKSASIIMSGISSREKQLVMLANSSHVCTLDLEREQVLSLVLKQLRHIDATKSLAN